MFRRNRFRRGPYALAEESAFPRLIKTLVWAVIIGLLLFYTMRVVLAFFGAGNALQRKAVALSVEKGSTVSVSIEGGLMKRTETGVPLYAGDKVSTGTKGHGTLAFFDTSTLRLDEQTDLTVSESVMGEEESAIKLELERGSVWVKTPAATAFSGSISRTITTPALTITLPGDTEATISSESLIVYSAEGLGLSVQVKGASKPIVIGEGQQFSLPSGFNPDGDLYAYRSALTAQMAGGEFVTASRDAVSPEGGRSPTVTQVLTVTAPANGAVLPGTTVTVQGTVSSAVSKVRVNGVIALLDATNRTFSQDLVMDQDEVAINVDALDVTDTVIATNKRSVKRKPASLVKSPTITAPAKMGETYRTTEREIVLRGSNDASAAGIMVNEYRLQLFTPGKGTWSYLASYALGNMQVGTNTYNVYALDAAGNKSDPVTLTIIFDDGTLPATSEGSVSSGGAQASSAPIADESVLPKNPPLAPGTIAVTGPTAGMAHTATGSEFLLEGTTSSDTASMWVNGYKLQLYKAGKTTWNYIASVEYQTLKRGTNTYRIVARNAKDEIIDTMEYTVTY